MLGWCLFPLRRLQSQQSRLREAYVASPSDNNVVLHGYVEYFARLHQLFCYYPVVGRGCRIPARMIVDQDDSRCPLGDRFPEDLTRMHERRIEQPAGYCDVALETVLGVEYRDVKLFDRKILQTLGENLEDVARPAHWRPFLPLLR